MPSSQTPIRNSDVPLEPLPPPAPEPSFWQKYSLHHEFPLSAMASFVLHFSVVLFLALLGAMVFSWSSQDAAPVIGHVSIDDFGGRGLGKSGDDMGATTEATNAVQFSPLEPEKFETTSLPENVEVEKGPVSPGPISRRSTGDNDEGGSGNGRKQGVGDGPIPGIGTRKPKVDRDGRMKRWTVTFNYRTGSEYLDRLANLRAILAVPAADSTFLVFSDLYKRPAMGETQTKKQVEDLNRLYWRNDDEDAMRQLASVLGLKTVPQYVYTFLPQDLEKVLLEKELAYNKLTEAQLNAKDYETTFEAERQGEKWVVKVLSQKMRRQKD